jgi:hypothetical protein
MRFIKNINDNTQTDTQTTFCTHSTFLCFAYKFLYFTNYLSDYRLLTTCFFQIHRSTDLTILFFQKLNELFNFSHISFFNRGSLPSISIKTFFLNSVDCIIRYKYNTNPFVLHRRTIRREAPIDKRE